MLNEIDRDFYCSQFTRSIACIEALNKFREGPNCECYHRKYPTPEQYKEEYGEDVPDDMAVWYRKEKITLPEYTEWYICDYSTAKEEAKAASDECRAYQIVIACTPFGKPDDDWRPE